MAQPRWFARLELAHSTPTRIRVRYRFSNDAPHEPLRLERALQALDGVEQARVNASSRSFVLVLQAPFADAAAWIHRLRGLTVTPLLDQGVAGAAASNDDLVAVTASGSALLVAGALAPGLRAPVAVASAVPVFGKAIEDVLGRGVTSHVLEALAVAISIGQRDFTAANITTFLLALGEYMEHSIAQRSDTLLKHLLKPASTQVWVERAGQEVQVPSEALQCGDIVIAATGTVVPVDGTVMGGEALINEATMTGESVPVARKRGDRVLSGTLVEEGRIRIYAEQVGRNAAAARIADFVEQSLTTKSKTQLEASRLADRLVPMVLGLAGATWLLTNDWQRVAAVLQADYSCALKLATPVAFKAAMYTGGRHGTLIKSASALERLAEADTFVFDKTGTLTTGQLEVTDTITFDAAYSVEDVLNMAASVEEHYFHPMAQAVVEASRLLSHPRHFNHKEVEFIVAHGVASEIAGQRIVVGSRHFIEDDEGIEVAPHAVRIDALRAEGKTLLYIGFGGRLLGVLAMRDSVRHNAAATLARLRKMGVRRILMLTGDQPERAQALAQSLSIDECHAGLLPQDKANILQQLSGEGAKLAFIGDGVNDAPALTGSNVGISMHQGADIARLAADVVLLEDDLARVADAKALALATKRLIDSNFHLTVGLNTSILAAATLGWITPVSASLLHNGSTIAILLRSLVAASLPRPPRRRRKATVGALPGTSKTP